MQVESGDGELTDETSSSMGDTTCSSPAIHDEPDPKMNPVKWNVAEVVRRITIFRQLF